MKENGTFSNKLPKKPKFDKMNNCHTKSSVGITYHQNPLQISERYKIKHYYIGRKWEKHTKLKKSNVADIFVGVSKIRNP